MNISRLRLRILLATLASPAALLFTGCSKSDDTSSAMDKAKADASSVGTSISTTAANSWGSVKNYSYERRADFSASVDRMSADMDDKARALKAKMAGVPDAASHDRDSAVQDYDSARAELKARMTDLGNATADTWASAKDKVAQAWQHVEDAYAKLTSSSTT